MSETISPVDRELDARWRERFGEPLPILGAHAIVRKILARPLEPRRPSVRGSGAGCRPNVENG